MGGSPGKGGASSIGGNGSATIPSFVGDCVKSGTTGGIGAPSCCVARRCRLSRLGDVLSTSAPTTSTMEEVSIVSTGISSSSITSTTGVGFWLAP